MALVESIAMTKEDVADIEYAKKVYEELERHYAGHLWGVGANIFGGVVDIQLAYDHPSGKGGFGYQLHMNTLDTHDGWQKIKKAGGELLERYGLPATPATEQSRVRALQHGLDKSGALK